MATREEGLAALQRGDAAAAIEQLEPVCQQDPNDFLSHMYLGAAYGMSGRNDEAIATITRAVQLEPSNPQARFNLGVALERAGWPNEALTAFEQAVALQPVYPQAQQSIARLQAQVGPAQPAPTQVMPAQPSNAPQEMGLAGYSQAPHNAPSPGPTPGVAPTMQLQYPPAQPGAQAYGAYPMTPVVEDRFDLVQAFKDWARTIYAPAAFFAEQRGREGMKAPMATLLAYIIMSTLFTVISTAMHGSGSGAYMIGVLFGGLIGGYLLLILTTLIIGGMFHLLGNAFGNQAPYSGSVRAYVYAYGPATLLGLIRVLFIPMAPPASMQQPFSPAPSPPAIHVYTTQFSSPPPGAPGGPGGPMGRPGAPGPGGPNAFGAPGAPGGGAFTAPAPNPMDALGAAFNPLSITLSLVSLVWTFVLLIIALPQIQGITSGAAVGVVLLTGLILLAIAFLLVMVLGVALVGVFMGAKGAGAAGAAGGLGGAGTVR
jgi:hypothetical protein